MKTKDEVLKESKKIDFNEAFTGYELECIMDAMERFAMQFEDDNGRANYYEDKIDLLNRISESKSNEITRKIEIHIETTEECMENFNIDKTTKELLEQDNKLFREIIELIK